MTMLPKEQLDAIAEIGQSYEWYSGGKVIYWLLRHTEAQAAEIKRLTSALELIASPACLYPHLIAKKTLGRPRALVTSVPIYKKTIGVEKS